MPSCRKKRHADLTATFEVVDEQTYVLTENIEREVKDLISLDNIYDECESKILKTDFTQISDRDVPSSLNILHFVLDINDLGVVTRCGVLDYNKIAGDHLGPQSYDIVEMSEFDEMDDACIE